VKRVIILLGILLITALCWSELYYPAYSVAAPEGYTAARVNPSALAFKNGSGFTLERYYNHDLKTFKDEFALYFTGENLSYIFDHGKNDEHSILFSTALLRNLYYGLDYSWTNKYFKEGDFEHSLLFRPNEIISLGATGREFFDEKKSEYVLGTALRPFYFQDNWGSRITFSADVHYSEEEWEKPVVGLQTELLNGIFLGGSYQLETETFGVNFGLRFGTLGLGTSTAFDAENDVSGGSWYVNFSKNYYRTVFDSKKKNQFYNLKLKGDIKEKKTGFNFGPIKIINQKDKTLSEIITKINELKEEERIDGILFKSANFNMSFAGIQELQAALSEFRSTGKKVIFYYENISNKQYIFAASVADEIYMHPSGWLDLKGLSITAPYVSELLDTLGIEVINFKSHDYKTAGNMFTETEMTAAERETYEYILLGLYDEAIDMINSGREDKLQKSIEELIDEGPYMVSQKALEAGLIDGLIYEDELQSKLEEYNKDAEVVNSICENKQRYDWSDEATDKVAVIYCVGNIHSGKGKLGRSIGSITTAKAIKNAREDKSIKGIILRVDSGGGSALASDVIHREVALCNSGDDQKPVIVSMAGVAASGGYFISAMSDMIIAQPSTITGSIGVIGLQFNLTELYKKIHLNWSTVKMGENADLGNTSRKMTEIEKEKISESIAASYEQFISFVAEGRDLSVEDVHKVAQGRVWTGKQALERGLVDKLGGMKLAMKEMTRIAELDHEIELVEYDGFGSRGVSTGISMNSDLITDQLPVEMKSFYDTYQNWKLYGDEKILKVLPYDLEIQ